MIPPRGVWCRDCQQKKDHFCQAQIYVDVDDAGLISPPTPLCLPCADGEPCSVDRVGKPPAADEIPLFQPESEPAPVRTLTPEEVGVPCVVAAEPPRIRDEESARREDEKRRQARLLLEAVALREKGRDPEKILESKRVERRVMAYPAGTPYSVIAVETGAPRNAVARLRRPAGLPGRDPHAMRAPRKVKLQVSASANGAGLQEKVIGGEPVRMSPGAVMGPEILNPARESEAMTIASGRKPGSHIPQEIKEAIRSASPDTTHAELARQYGVSDVTVGALRREKPAKKKAAKKPSKPASETLAEAGADRREARANGHDAPRERLMLEVPVELDEAREILQNLTPVLTLKALSSVFAEYVRGLRG